MSWKLKTTDAGLKQVLTISFFDCYGFEDPCQKKKKNRQAWRASKDLFVKIWKVVLCFK